MLSPISTVSFWRRKVIPTAHSLSWHTLAQGMGLVPGVVCSCTCAFAVSTSAFYLNFFSRQAHKKKDCSPNFCSSKRSPIMALLRTSLMKTGCHSMDFCRIRLDIMQLSLYAFTSLFQDDSFSACENSGRWEEKNKKSVWSQCQNCYQHQCHLSSEVRQTPHRANTEYWKTYQYCFAGTMVALYLPPALNSAANIKLLQAVCNPCTALVGFKRPLGVNTQ